MRDFWLGGFNSETDGISYDPYDINHLSTVFSQQRLYYTALTYGGGGTTYRLQYGGYKSNLYLTFDRLSSSASNIPTSNNLGEGELRYSDDTAEIRPYNFAVRMYMKL